MTDERLVDVGEVRLRCLVDGPPSGRPVLLLHGAGSAAKTWAALSAALTARDYRTVAPDLRGHGGSSRSRAYTLRSYHADIACLLDALDIDTVEIVGHSLGAYVAMALARTSPDRCERLVLEEPPPPPRTDARPAARIWLNNVKMVAAGLRHRDFDPAAVRSVVAQLRRPDPGWWSGLDKITAPTLLVTGGPQSHIDQDELRAVADRLPQCRQITIAVGHRIHSRASKCFVDAALDFLAGPGAQL